MSEFTLEERVADLEQAVIELSDLIRAGSTPTLQEQSTAWREQIAATRKAVEKT